MLKYCERKNTASYKWDELHRDHSRDNLLPLWVADMDFEEPDCIKDACRHYVENPLGYYRTPDAYYDNFIAWEKDYHHYSLKKEWIEYAVGVVPAIHWIINIFSKPGDAVIVNTPVYPNFLETVEQTGRKLIKNDMVRVDNRYQIDMDEFEKEIIDHDVKIYILCNPHNPTGTVWTENELTNVLTICRKHKVLVISDEIHADFVNPHYKTKATSAGAIQDFGKEIITLTSAGKTFNLGGVQNAFAIIENPDMRNKFVEYRASIGVEDGNGLGYVATTAGYGAGRQWFEELKSYIYDNEVAFRTKLTKAFPEMKFTKLEGTYLTWIDLSPYFENQDQIIHFCEEECGIAPSYGASFGGEKYQTFIRVNLATSRENLNKAADEIIRHLPEAKKAQLHQ